MAIYKPRNTGMWNRMRVMQGTRGMFTRNPGNVLILAFRECSKRFRGMLEKIPGNVPEDSGECSERFWGHIQADSGECSKRFR